MESIVFLDTHIVIWLFSKRLDLISKRALTVIRKNELLISPIVRLELEYLYEIGKISAKPEIIINTLKKEIQIRESNELFSQVIDSAILNNWTRDPFDRIITAQAAINNARLITKDRSILSNYNLAFWD